MKLGGEIFLHTRLAPLMALPCPASFDVEMKAGKGPREERERLSGLN